MRAFWLVTVGCFVLFSLMFGLGMALGLADESTWRGWLEGAATATEGSWWLTAGLIAAALVLDLFLPVPSSVVMTLSGALLGMIPGFFVSLLGSLGGALLGYWLCRRFGRGWFAKLAGASEVPAAERFFSRYGPWGILLSRAVPMLAETVSCLAGLTRMPAGRFVWLSLAGTLPICGVYAWAGQHATQAQGLGIAIVVALALPAFGFLALTLLRRADQEERSSAAASAAGTGREKR